MNNRSWNELNLGIKKVNFIFVYKKEKERSSEEDNYIESKTEILEILALLFVVSLSHKNWKSWDMIEFSYKRLISADISRGFGENTRMTAVLVSYCCHNKLPQIHWNRKIQIYYLKNFRGQKSKM